jgi:hypothetical protein
VKHLVFLKCRLFYTLCSSFRFRSLLDISNNIIDSFIILICLQGISQALIYEKYLKYIALPLVLDRLKQTWFYLNNSLCNEYDNEWMKISLIKFQVESIIDTFYLHSNQSNEQLMLFSLACASAWKKLEFWNLSIWFSRDYFYENVKKDYQYQRIFTYLMNEDNFNEIIKIIHSEQMSNEKLQFLISFLPESLQQLYYYAIISSTNNVNKFIFVIFLSECLIYFEEIDPIDENHYFAILLLYPLFKEYQLENYALSIFNNEKYSNYTSFLNKNYPEFLRKISKHYDLLMNDQSNHFLTPIDIERQRIQQTNHQNQEKDLQLFSGLISFARILQISYYSNECHGKKTMIIIDSKDSEQIYSTINNISNPILRIIASSIILDMKDPLIFDEEQRDELKSKIIIELQSLLPQVSLLIGTILFIRSYKISHQLSHIIIEKFHQNLFNKQYEIIKAVFIALKQLKNFHLSCCLLEFIKQQENLSDLFKLKSSIFYDYIQNTTSFNSSNTILLSLMYLLELIFDCQFLRIFIKDDYQEKISPMKELQQLWNESSKTEKIITYNITHWITNNIKILTKQDQKLIIENVSKSLRIEKKALIEIEKWLYYDQTDNILNFFSYYAALQLFINDRNIPGLIDIIDKMFINDNKFRLKSILENSIHSLSVNLNIIREILILLHKNYHNFSNISIRISSTKMFELFLDLELERILLNNLSNSFFLMINSYSKDFQSYLLKIFPSYLNFQFQCENIIKDKYFSIIIQSMNEQMTSYHVNEDISNEFSIKLFQYIFNIPNIEQFPLVLHVILKALDLIYIGRQRIERIFFQNHITLCLENMIYSSDKYTEDVLAACLLTYSHYLLNSHQYKICRNISNDLKTQLIILSKKSNSLIISIRASFCLIFIEYSNITSMTILNWFENQSNMTSEKRYKILIEQTLYSLGEAKDLRFVNEICDQLEKHSTEFLDLFVIDLYNYLCEICENDIHSYFTPGYIRIFGEISQKKWNEFQNAIQRSSFGEEKFKRQLYFCFKRDPKHCNLCINFYARFGIVTDEFIEMCGEHKRNYLCDFEPYSHMNYLKDISDRDIIDNLFQELQNQKIDGKKFRSYLWILEYLVKNNLISSLELHSRIQFSDNISFDDDETDSFANEQYIFKLLLKNSCYQGNELFNVKTIDFTKNDIDEKFEKIIDIIDKRFILCIRKNKF